MKKKVLVGIAGLVIIGAIYTALNPPAQEVKVYQVQVGKIQQSVNETGLVQASDYLDIYNTEYGKVESLPVKIGAKVSKGDTLAVLINNDLGIQKSTQQSALIQANNSLALVKANLERTKLDEAEAKNNYARTEKLYKAGAVSQSQLEEMQTIMDKINTTLQEQYESFSQTQEQVQVLEKALQDINAKEEGLIITSPIEGTVVRLPVKEEQFLAAGTPVAQVASLNQMEIKSEILSDDMADIAVGQTVKITAPLLKETFLAGEVVQIYPQAEEKLSALGVTEYRVPVIINLPEANKLRPGYEVKVSIDTLAKDQVIIIPREAVIYNEDGHKTVMVMEKGRVKYMQVETGLGDRTNIEISEGLEAGQKIVLDGSSLLKEGTRVKEILTK